MPAPIADRLQARVGLSAEQLWLVVGLFVVAYGTNVSTPLLVLYQERLELGDGETMTIFVAYVAGILASLLLAGPLSDRIGRRAVCLPAMLVTAAASTVIMFGRDEYVLLVSGRALLGASTGAFVGVASAWMQELMGRGAELRAAAVTTLTVYIGFGSGPLITALLDAAFPAPLVVPLLVHVGLVAFALLGVASVPETRTAALRGSARPRLRIEFGLPAGSRGPFLLVLAPVAFFVFSFPSNSFALFPVLLREAMDGFEVLIAGLSGAFTAWSALLSRPVIARMGARRALPLGMAGGVAGLLFGAASFATDWWPLLLPAASLLGASSGVLMTGGLAITSEIATDESRGALTSTFYVFAYIGMATPILITTLSDIWSTSAALLALTTVAAVVGVATSRTVRMI